MKFENLKKYAPVIVRIGISLVFLWFGANQLLYPANWIGWVPTFVSAIVSAGKVVFLNGIFEVIFGLLLLFGIYTRLVSLLLALHLLSIALPVGINEIGVRDFGLFMATLSIFFNGADFLCLDKKFRKNV